MKNEKVKLQILNDDGSVKTEKLYKSFKDLANDINIEYHIIRQINAVSEGKVIKKFTHPNMSILLKKFKVVNVKPKLSLEEILKKF